MSKQSGPTDQAPELGKVPSEAPLYLWSVLETEQSALSAYAVLRHVSGEYPL